MNALSKFFEIQWVRPRTACEIGGFGLTTCYRLIGEGRLVTKKIDGMRLISVASIAGLGAHPEPSISAAA